MHDSLDRGHPLHFPYVLLSLADAPIAADRVHLTGSFVIRRQLKTAERPTPMAVINLGVRRLAEGICPRVRVRRITPCRSLRLLPWLPAFWAVGDDSAWRSVFGEGSVLEAGWGQFVNRT